MHHLIIVKAIFLKKVSIRKLRVTYATLIIDIKIRLRLVLHVILLMIIMTVNRMKSVKGVITVLTGGISFPLTIAKKQNLFLRTDMPSLIAIHVIPEQYLRKSLD